MAYNILKGNFLGGATPASGTVLIWSTSDGYYKPSLIVNANIDPSAAIAYSKLSLSNSIVNSDVSSSAAIAYSKLNLATSILNSDISASAAIAYSKLALSNSIVNADVASAAAISGTKISPDFGSQNITTTGALLLSSGTRSSSGNIRFSNNSGIIIAQRNAGNSGDLVFNSLNTTDGYIGSDTSKANNLTNINIAPSTATNIFAGSNSIASFISTGTQLGGGAASFGSGTGVLGLTYASVNPSANPSGGIVIYADTSDGYLKYRQANGYVVKLDNATSGFTAGGDLTGTNTSQTVAKINGATVPAAGSLTTNHVLKVSGTSATTYGYILNANVDSAAAIAYSKLSLSNSIVNADINSSAAIAYSKLNLATSIVNADISASAAIAYSKLALSNSIVNADISSSAAIAGSKINPAFGAQNITGSGNFGLGSSPTYGSGTGVFYFANAGSNPSSNPTGGIIAYVDSADGYLKYRTTTGNIVNLNGVGFTAGGDLTGNNTSQTVAKINGATVPAAGSLTTGHVLQVSGTSATTYGYVVNANVDSAAAIAGTKISPDFGSQQVQTTGGFATGVNPATTGAIRLSNLDLIYARNAANSADVSLLYLDGSNNVRLGSNTSNQANVQIDTSSSSSTLIRNGGTAVATFANTTITLANPVIFGSTTSSTGTLRFANNSGNIIAIRNAGNSADLVGLSFNTTDGYVGSDTSKSTNLTNLHLTPSTATNIFAGSTQIAQFVANGTQLGGGLASMGGGTGVIGITYASVNPSTNPSGGVVFYADSSDGYAKYRMANGNVIILNGGGAGGAFTAGGDLSGTNTSQTVIKINGASVPAAGSLTTGHVLKVSGASATSYGYVLDANVDSAAAIAGTKIAPNFGSQNVTTSGNFAIGSSPSYGSGSGVFYIANAGANPSTNPVGGLVAYVDSADGYFKTRTKDGYVVTLNGAGGLSNTQHRTLRQLIHLADIDGPTAGFASGAYRETTGGAFPSSIIWYTSAAKTFKIMSKEYTYSNSLPATITHKVYDTDGITVLEQVVDTITYTNSLETSRTRTIT